MEEESTLIKQKEDLYQEMANISAELICLNRKYNTAEIPSDLDEKITQVNLTLNSYSPEFKVAHKDKSCDGVLQEIIILGQKLDPIPKETLENIINTDYSTETQIDRPAILKKIKNLQAITYKPHDMVVKKTPLELKRIIDTYKHQPLQPLEVCKISSLTSLNEKYDNTRLIEQGLPNYDDIAKEVTSLKGRIQAFQVNFGSLVFNGSCGECKANRQNINKIFDVEYEKGRLNGLVEILNKKNETTQAYNQAVAYRDQKAQNDILLRNQSTMASNQKINSNLDDYQRAKDELKHLQNKFNWDTLQKLERQVNWDKERMVKQAHNERLELNEIHRYVTSRDSLEQLMKLNKIREENVQINEEIVKLNQKNSATEVEISLVNQALAKHAAEFNKEKDRYSSRKRLVTHHKENLEKLEFLDLYQQVINCKSGIPSYILKQTCMMIEKNCNKILTKIADFTLSIVYDKEVKIFTLENDISIPASMGSGMQKFVLDLIFRITLTQISSISCPKTLFVDEGFGSLDAENFIAIANILQKLKSDFDSLIIISHIAELRNYVDMSIDITRKDYLSSVTFGELTDDQKALQLTTEIGIINKRNADFVNSTQEAKKPKIPMDEKVQKYCDDNGGIEAIMFDISDAGIHCRACKKDYQVKHGFVERHLNASTAKSKHDKFLLSLLNSV